jgi:ankyrin repeat protein
MAKFLLENGADVNAISNDGSSPLKCALRADCGTDVVALLLEHGADVSVLDTKEADSRMSRANRRIDDRINVEQYLSPAFTSARCLLISRRTRFLFSFLTS